MTAAHLAPTVCPFLLVCDDEEGWAQLHRGRALVNLHVDFFFFERNSTFNQGTTNSHSQSASHDIFIGFICNIQLNNDDEGRAQLHRGQGSREPPRPIKALLQTHSQSGSELISRAHLSCGNRTDVLYICVYMYLIM